MLYNIFIDDYILLKRLARVMIKEPKMNTPSKTKFGPIKEASDKTNNQYRHLNSFLSTPKDKIRFMTKMGFTPKQICKKLDKSYLFVMNTLAEQRKASMNGGPK